MLQVCFVLLQSAHWRVECAISHAVEHLVIVPAVAWLLTSTVNMCVAAVVTNSQLLFAAAVDGHQMTGSVPATAVDKTHRLTGCTGYALQSRCCKNSE